MSVPVELSELADKMRDFGSIAYLITTGDEGAPHVVSIVLNWDGEDIAAAVGNRTQANARTRPDVTLLWPGTAGADYSLIVDGTARVTGDGRVAVTPTRAVLHRLPSADTSLPSCVPVLDRR